jgi:RNA polymerase sigma factor (sigma-70 family)
MSEKAKLNLEANFDLIRKIVHSYIATYPNLEFDDLFSEACLACLENQHRYDPTRGKETTFIWYAVHGRIRKMLKKKIFQTVPIPEDGDIESDEKSPEWEVIAKERWEDFLESLSDEARVICSLVLEGDTYLPIDKPKICRKMISEILKDQNWNQNSIWARYKEIRAGLSLTR